MLLYVLFAVAFGQECQTRTCAVCKTDPACDWYGYDCLFKNSTAVTSLGIPATASCSQCQAGNCSDCFNQLGCGWFSNSVPGVPGMCGLNTSSTPTYTLVGNNVSSCPACTGVTPCSTCGASLNGTCNWYQLPGGIGGKCSEAAPSFAYTQVPKDCTVNPCVGVPSCQACQAVTNATNASVCAWFSSKEPAFYGSKCDSIVAGVVDSTLYTEVSGTCPVCAGTSCADCQAEAGCKWVAVSLGLASVFGQCLQTTATTPSTKSIVNVCPVTCQVYSCNQCTAIPACSWFTGGPEGDDDLCDLNTATTHLAQHPAPTPCPACLADRCYECNGLPGCGWYADEKLDLIIAQGCFATPGPSGRTLLSNTNSKCKGVPGTSSQVTISIGVLLVLAFLA